MSNLSSDPIKAMLGMGDREVVPSEGEKRERLDLSRCVMYAVRDAEEAKGLFRARFGVEPTVCVHRVKYGFTVGLTPENSDHDD